MGDGLDLVIEDVPIVIDRLAPTSACRLRPSSATAHPKFGVEPMFGLEPVDQLVEARW